MGSKVIVLLPCLVGDLIFLTIQMALVYLASLELYHPTSKQAHITGSFPQHLTQKFYLISIFFQQIQSTNTKCKVKRLFLSKEKGKGGGLYRIYELEGQTLGFRKIYDWLNKLKLTTSQTKRYISISDFGVGGSQKSLRLLRKCCVKKCHNDCSRSGTVILNWMNCLILESTATASLVKLECLILKSGSMVLVNWGVGGAGRRQQRWKKRLAWLAR